MIVVDTSALIALLFREPQAPALAERLAQESRRYLSVVSYVETGTVLAWRRLDDPWGALPVLDDFLTEADVLVHEVDEVQMRTAMSARIEFGRGFGAAAGLNFGDCFSYALARHLGAPLLFVGNDFAATDIEPALRAP